MIIGEEKEYNGTEYMAVAYNGEPADFMPDEYEDPQCKLCALMPNWCGMMKSCHGEEPFVFVLTRYINAMKNITI